ncbi:agmatinase family protein [Anditalea andensis]|uniref:Agmatinase n=1 Tax=Anditalea andensis TaxID=1048983 RepID=A0A074LJ61_9BACT|nr:agmatinase family protein [Anditalea andensis]KEO73857.1 agmatinase [Anditalea andensis]
MSLKHQLIDKFDPSGIGSSGSLFGLPFDEETAEVIVIPVPWEVTVSYSPGTVNGPETVLNASPQLDLYQGDIKDAWKMGIHMIEIPEHIKKISDNYRTLAKNYIKFLEMGEPEHDMLRLAAVPDLINKASEEMNLWVYQQVKHYRAMGKLVALLGGDHSTPLGMLKAIAEDEAAFGILQIDAHADLRVAYENFTYSHASISYNALQLPQVSKLVQVGIRDYAESEAEMATSDKRIATFYDKDIKESLYGGRSWKSICEDIVKELPDKVYVTIDIDGLDPKLCPNTGTPVPGGLEMEEMLYLMKMVVLSGKEIIGFDVVEVAPGPDGEDWNGNVGARVLYRMCNLYGASNGRLKLA